MTQPVNDTDYADDHVDVAEDSLPETDPTTIPPDEGDAGVARV